MTEEDLLKLWKNKTRKYMTDIIEDGDGWSCTRGETLKNLFPSSVDPMERTFAPSPVDHPPHYTSHPSGIECIDITEHMSFCLGNALKYVWRADLKGNAVEDLEKARWYIDREISLRKRNQKKDD